MTTHKLTEIAEVQLAHAKKSPNGRSSQMLVGEDDGLLQQTVVALTEGHVVASRDSTEHSTLQILTGAVRVRTTEGPEDVGEGSLVEVPTEPHVIRAEKDTTALLTEAKSVAGGWDTHIR